jgi:hypothetical protein
MTEHDLPYSSFPLTQAQWREQAEAISRREWGLRFDGDPIDWVTYGKTKAEVISLAAMRPGGRPFHLVSRKVTEWQREAWEVLDD